MRWLLLRGLAREQRHWGGFPAVFEARVTGSSVVCLDLPGAGTEHLRASPDRIEAIADDLRARWLALGAAGGEPWGLLAMSLGGMVAMAWADAHPGDFERVVLASTSAAGLSPPWRRFGLGVLPGVLRAFSAQDAERREALILGLTTRRVADVAAVARDWAALGASRPMRRANVVRQLRAAARFRAPARLAVPTLVLAGDGDRLVDPSCSRVLAAHLGAPSSFHPEAGHELALDAPDWLCDQIAAWR